MYECPRRGKVMFEVKLYVSCEVRRENELLAESGLKNSSHNLNSDPLDISKTFKTLLSQAKLEIL